jgi:hypothetical protein
MEQCGVAESRHYLRDGETDLDAQALGRREERSDVFLLRVPTKLDNSPSGVSLPRLLVAKFGRPVVVCVQYEN